LTKRQTLPRPTNRDRIVWALAAKGVGDDEIQLRLRIDAEELELAKLRVQAHAASISTDVVALAVNEEILAVARGGGVRDAINGALRAERVLVTSSGVATVTDADGNETPVTEPDHQTRLEAARTFGKLLKDNQPSGPAVQVNTAINNSNSQTNIIGGGRSFEARRRAAAERRGVAVADAVPVAEEDADEPLDGENVDVELDDPDVAEDSPNDDE
jgi:hypothetical protein